MITTWMIAGLAAFIAWLSVRSMNRDKAGRDRISDITTRVHAVHGIQDVFVSP